MIGMVENHINYTEITYLSDGNKIEKPTPLRTLSSTWQHKFMSVYELMS